jgi:hypothetical protein
VRDTHVQGVAQINPCEPQYCCQYELLGVLSMPVRLLLPPCPLTLVSLPSVTLNSPARGLGLHAVASVMQHPSQLRRGD